MALYHMEFDHTYWYVEAASLRQAVELWRQHVMQEWGDDYDPLDEPESIHRLHEEPVLREGQAVITRALPPVYLLLIRGGEDSLVVYRNELIYAEDKTCKGGSNFMYPAARIAALLARALGVSVDTRNVPSALCDKFDWGYDDAVAWLEEQLHDSTPSVSDQ